MASSREARYRCSEALGLLACLLTSACAAGNGTGTITGTASAPGCGLDGDPYDLRPSYFSADTSDYLPDSSDDFLEIRIQRGSDLPDVSDQLTIFVGRVATVKTMQLGVPLEVGEALHAPVRMSLGLNATCGFDWYRRPVNYVGVSGTITFSALYARSVDDDDLEIAATFADVAFVDHADPANRWALLSGEFSFLFNRGRPAQVFP